MLERKQFSPVSASASSITTRIKTFISTSFFSCCKVRVHLPLQQGLRQLVTSLKLEIYPVRVHLPLKQGLRHPYNRPPPSY